MRQYVVSFALFFAGLSAPALWSATPGEPDGISNFHAVNDHIYRGAQPSSAGFDNLAKLGIKTVIDLREGGAQGRAERKLVEAAGMHYIHIPMAGLGAPKDEQIGTVLNLLDDSSGWPVFVHCKRGMDRTGTVIACYRVAHDHWDNRKALSEAHAYGLHWIEQGMQQYIVHFKPAGKPVLLDTSLKPAAATP